MRAFYIIGDDFNGNSIFSKIVQAAARGERNFPFTTGKNKYDFINVDELASQIVSASTQNKINGIINVCSGKPVSLAERVERFIDDNRLDIKLIYGKYPDRIYDSPIMYGDITKINEIMKRQIADT